MLAPSYKSRTDLTKMAASTLLEGYENGRRDFQDLDLREIVLDWKALSEVDLSGSNLKGAFLEGINLHRATLEGVNLEEANLYSAKLTDARIHRSWLENTILIEADVRRTRISEAYISGLTAGDTNFDESHFLDTWIEASDFGGSSFRFARFLRGLISAVRFEHADLYLTEFHACEIEACTFANLDLTHARGLETLDHKGSSVVGVDTFYISRNAPVEFLRGCGVPEALICLLPTLGGTLAPDYYSCFISHSRQDEVFAKQLYADLQARGVRCWFAPRDLPIGAKTRHGIDDAISFHDKLLVVLSKDSIGSEWVAKEVETAFEKERIGRGIVLFPLRIDGEVFGTAEPWAADLRRSRNIADFSAWQNPDRYRDAVDDLLRALGKGGRR